MNNCNKSKECCKCIRPCCPNEIICPAGPIGPVGPTGPTGPTGQADTIVVGKTITTPAGTIASVSDCKVGNQHTLEFAIPRGYDGATGATGPTGPTLMRSAYLVTFEDGTSAYGVPIPSLARLPIDRSELDISNILTLDSTEETIKFNQIGYYKVTFVVSAYVLGTNGQFDKDKDFVTIGFRQCDTDNIYIGGSKWIYNEQVEQVTGQGIVVVDDVSKLYELVNLSKETIRLFAPDIKNISSKSYFTNPLVNIIIEFLGKQI